MKKNGFTLIELLVSIPIGAVLVLVVAASYFQLSYGSIAISHRSIGINDIDRAMHRISQDLVAAQSSDLIEDGEPVPYMTLEWVDLTHWAAESGDYNHAASYYLSEKKLYRSFDGQVTTVASYISFAGFSLNDRQFTVTLTSQPGTTENAITRTITCEMRADEP